MNPYKIAIILPAEPEYSSQLIEGALAYVEEHPEITLLEMPFIRKKGVSPLPDGPLEFDGALLWLNLLDVWIERMIAEDVVVVNVNNEWNDLNLPIVAFDSDATEKLALDHLTELGYPQIAYIGTTTSMSESRTLTQNNFLNEGRRRGLEIDSFEIGSVDGIDNRITNISDKAVERLRTFLTNLEKPTAIWCEDDYLARIICDQAILIDLKIPEDLAVLGLSDCLIARISKPQISTIPQPGKLIGHRAVELIHQLLSGESLPTTRVSLPPPPVIIRQSTSPEMVTDKRFELIYQWIQDHACEGLTVNELVKMLPMSQVTFSKLFFRIFGCTPGEEIRKVKVKKAKHYLRSTDFSVEHISDLCGFSQSGKFSKFFKRQVGTTPSVYRKGNKREAKKDHQK